MGIFDDLKKKAEQLASDASKLADKTLKDASAWTEQAAKESKEWTEKAANDTKAWTKQAIKDTSDIDIRVNAFKEWGANTIKDIATNAQEFIETDKHKEIASQVGDFTVKAAKTVSGVTAYNERKEANEKKKEADKILAETQKRIDEMRFLANNRLETFGMAKCEILKTTVGRFIKIVSQLKNSVKVKEYDLSLNLNIKENDLVEMESVEMNASNALKTAAVSGSFAVIAACGVPGMVTSSVAALATASTGTAISSLSGAAATNATMAWLGGGSIAAGGGGVAAGAAVLTSITVAATGIFALASAAVVAASFYSQKNTEAENYLAQVKEWEAKTNGAIEIMRGIVRRSDELLTVSSRLEGRVVNALDELEAIVPIFSIDNPEHVKKFQKAAILTKSMSELAQAPLLDETGNVNENTLILAESTKKILNSSL